MLPPVLTDINIAAPAVQWLIEQGIDVLSAQDEGWYEMTDSELLAAASENQRFVLTHDSDFGMLAIYRGQTFHGIIYLRPGGRPPAAVIDDLGKLNSLQMEWEPGTLAVFRSGRLRIRRMA